MALAIDPHRTALLPLDFAMTRILPTIATVARLDDVLAALG